MTKPPLPVTERYGCTAVTSLRPGNRPRRPSSQWESLQAKNTDPETLAKKNPSGTRYDSGYVWQDEPDSVRAPSLFNR